MEHELLSELHRRGIRLRLADGRLDVLAPAGSLTDELRVRLRAAREELIELLGRADHGGPAAAIVPRPEQRYEPFPLTDIQHAYWVGRNPAIEMGGIATHAYLETATEDLDVDRLARALRKVIERHDMLRAIIEPSGLQRVLPEVPAYEIRVADLRGLSEAEQEAHLESVREEMGHQVLPADRWPVFDIRASRLDDRRLRIHLSLDMLIMDGFSMDLLFQEWRRFYEDPRWIPEPLELSYRDCVMAQLEARDGAEYARAERYWAERLDTLPPAPELPMLPSRPGRGAVEFRRRHSVVPKEKWAAIKEAARRRGVTPSAALVTAFTDVLRRWSKEPGHTLNLTLFNRPPLHPQVDSLMGDFTSVTLLSTDSEPQDTFAARAGVLHRRLIQDLEHLSYSGVQVLRERARRQGGMPGAAMPVVFTSMLGASSDAGLTGGLKFLGEIVNGVSQTPQVWLDHQVTEEHGELHLNWDAAEELFPAGLLDDMFAVYEDLVARLGSDEGLWDDPGPGVALPAWQERERRAANDTEAPIPERTLCSLVEEQAERTPDATAVLAADGRYTYGELLGQERRLAHRLVDLGARTDELIAVVMPKCREQVAAAVGITRSGAAYLPLDPQWPAARRAQLYDRCSVRVAVTTPELRERLDWPDGIQVVTFDDSEVRSAPITPPSADPAPTDLAYTIFTSGSTGQPKGVVIDHRGAANTVQDINQRFEVGPDDRVLSLSSLSFDLSVYDVFGTLAAGAAVVLPSPEDAHDPAHWTDLVRRHDVTVWNSVPALMQAWTDSLKDADSPASTRSSTLRLALLSGDWIPVALPDTIRAHHPRTQVISLGGATEASIWSVAYPIGEVPDDWTRIPYGKPLARQTLHVYDERLEPCPVWATGEIYIGGVGVAKGYWGDAEKTAERFLTHPRTGERIYRTGDLGRYLPGGDIDFLGREDSQIKLNGYRIELGEIEATLARQDGVAEAVVAIGTNPTTGRAQLVGYVVPESGGAADAGAPGDGELLRQVAERAGERREREQAARAQELRTEERTHSAADALCPLVIARSLAQLGFFRSAGDRARCEDIVASGIKPVYRELIGRQLAELATRGLLRAVEGEGQGEGEGAYRCERPFDAQALDAEIRRTLDGMDVRGPHGVLREYFAQCAEHQVAMLRGEVSPLEFLMPDGDWRVTRALYADNPVAQVQNRTVAQALRTFVDAWPGTEPVRILEVGAGTGGTTERVLPELPADRVRYCFTDISSYFTSRAEQQFKGAHPFLEQRVFDIDADPAEQGFAPGCADVILAANVLHDAKSIGQTLTRLRALLSPGGLLVLLESTVNMPSALITVGLIEGLAQERATDEQRLPLLSVARWREEVEAAGYTGFTSLPAEGAPDDLYMHVLLAAAPGGATPALDVELLRQGVEESLPEYMVPRHLLLLDQLPLSSNGKVDRGALPLPWQEVAAVTRVTPRDAVEQRLFELWSEALGRADFGVEDNFFDLGGDSLHVVSMLGPLREELGLHRSAQEIVETLLDRPTIAALAASVPEWSRP